MSHHFTSRRLWWTTITRHVCKEIAKSTCVNKQNSQTHSFVWFFVQQQCEKFDKRRRPLVRVAQRRNTFDKIQSTSFQSYCYRDNFFKIYLWSWWERARARAQTPCTAARLQPFPYWNWTNTHTHITNIIESVIDNWLYIIYLFLKKTKQNVPHNASRPNVNLCVVVLTTNQLGRHPIWRADDRVALLFLLR